MILARDTFVQTGIFGQLWVNDKLLLFTLEHAYEMAPDGASVSAIYAPKIPPGSYTCVRGTHVIGSSSPFVTFEITGVEGHTGLLFHPGNTNVDSSGCVLLGMARNENAAVLQSRLAFDNFMNELEGTDQFTLNVS